MSLTSAQRSWLMQQIEELLGVEDKVFSTLSEDDINSSEPNGVHNFEFENEAKVNFF